MGTNPSPFGSGGTSTAGQFNVQTYGAFGNGKLISDVVITSGQPTLISASANFTANDTGKFIHIAGGGGVRVPLVTTITFVNSTTVTLGANAGQTFTSGVPTQAIYGTDDTAAINAAVSAAMTYALTHGSAVVTGPPLLYCLAAQGQRNATFKGNAQVPIPLNVGAGTQKVTLVFDFGPGAPMAPMFSGGTVLPPQVNSSAVFVSMITNGTNDATWGAASVIGGPTPQQGFGNSNVGANWNNVQPVIRGLNILVPLNPTIAGIDFRGCASARVETYGYMPFDTIQNIAATGPTNAWVTGLWMPIELNNAEAYVGDVSIYGAFYGCAFYAHSVVHHAKSLYCVIGHFLGGNGNDKHASAAIKLGAYGCQQDIQVDGNVNVTIPVHLLLDVESMGFWNSGGPFQGQNPAHISDPNNGLGGRIDIADNSGVALAVTGGANCEIIYASQLRGHLASPPVVPASTVAAALVWRNSSVVVHTGAGVTVSAITVDGTATSQTVAAASSSVPITVPSGKTIALTYAGGTPTWDWWTS